MKPISGRRAIWLARGSIVMHALEAPAFGVGLAAGIFLTTRQAGEIVVYDRLGGAPGGFLRAGVLLLVGVTLVAGSLLFFHRKERLARHRLLAAAAAVAFFAIGYAGEIGEARSFHFFGLTTLKPRTSFVEDYPARPKVRYEINGWGLRGAEWAKEKPDGVVRVAVVGDSFVFGSGVEEDGTLPRKLDAALRGRFPGARFEVLNLGMPGDNLRSHLAMERIAAVELGADVVVLCLTLPNDLSAWDSHEERVARERVTSFSFASYLLGYRTAIMLWSDREVATRVTAENVAFLASEVASFSSARDAGPARPIVVFSYDFEDPRVTEVLRRIPNAVLMPPVHAPSGAFIPNDGHPTALGNELFARAIAGELDPAWIPAASR